MTRRTHAQHAHGPDAFDAEGSRQIRARLAQHQHADADHVKAISVPMETISPSTPIGSMPPQPQRRPL